MKTQELVMCSNTQQSRALLTRRELQVLLGVMEGKANKEIGGLLCISEQTVKSRLKTIWAKLSANDRTHAVVLAVKRGFLQI